MNNVTKPTILVVDDELDIRELVKDILEDQHYHVSVASNAETARLIVSKQQPHLILLDIWMPDIDGISLLREFKKHHPNTAIIMMSGHGTIETAVEATRLGANDFIEKPLSTAKLLHSIEITLEKQTKQSKQKLFATQKPIGNSQQITSLIEQAERFAKHAMPILLVGEDGAGKHCFAHYLHSLSQYADGKFIELTAETFPLDSLKLAALTHHTCLYINHVSNLSDKAQTLLIHMLDNDQFNHCQLLCASPYPLEQAVSHGHCQERLLYQLNNITLSIPPLREHTEDIPSLIEHFVDQYTTQSQLPYRHFNISAQNRLRNHPWPGNVLELKNVIRSLLLLDETNDININDVELMLQQLESYHLKGYQNYINYDLPIREAREQFERIYLLHQLNQNNGNIGKAAKAAGIERTHLYRKLRALDIDTKQL